MRVDMSWQDPEYVLPSEGELVICQVLERNGLVKGVYTRGMWLDMNRMPIDVVKWKELPKENAAESDEMRQG